VAFDFGQVLFRDRVALLEALRRGCGHLADQHVAQTVVGGAVENATLVLTVLGEALDFLVLDRAGTVVDLDPVTVEDANVDNRAGHARGQTQRGVAHVAGLFAEDRAQQLFFRGHRRFTLGGDLADQDVARMHFGADVDDARFVEVAQSFLADVRDVAGDVFRPKLGVAGHDFEFLDVDRGEHVVLDDALADQDRVFVVVAVPGHERDEHVAAQGQFAQLGRGTVSQDVASLDHVAHLHQRALVDAGRLVGAFELLQAVDVDARLAGFDIAAGADHDTGRVDLVDDPAAQGGNRCAGIARHGFFHAGADERRFGADQRYGLALHVRSHQRAVGVVVFQERNERGRNRNQLLGRNVHQSHVIARSHHEFAAFTGRDQFFDERTVSVQLGRCLGNGVLLLFHGRQVHDFAGDLAVHDLAVRGFDEAVLVDSGEGRQRVDQTDVRAFRRFDRADAAIVGRVNVADFEAGAFAGQTARPKGRNAALVGHFRQRVGLVHELRQLRRAEEFTHRSHGRLGVDQVVRHDGRHVDAAHAFLDRALHAQQADAVLVFQQFADRTDAAVAEVVDVVDFALAVLQVHQFLDHGEDVLGAQGGDGVFGVQAQAHVQLDAAHGRQVIAVRIEEQAFEQGFGGFARRRFAGAHDAVDIGQGVVAVRGLVGLQGVADPRTGRDVVNVQQFQLIDPGLVQRVQVFRADFVARFDPDAAGALVDQVACGIAAEDFLGRDQQFAQAVLFRLVGGARADLGAGGKDHFAALGVDHVERRLLAAPLFSDIGQAPAAFTALPGDGLVEVVEDAFVIQAQSVEQGRDRQLALAVDTDVDDVLRVEFEVQPRTAVRDHAGGEEVLARRVGLAAVMVEQHARRTVHLRHDDALGAVDDESAVLGHERHVAHVDVLLLDIEDRPGFGFGVDFKDDQAQRDLHRRGIGDPALAALGGVVLRVFQFVVNEVQLAGAGKVADRENRTQRLFQARDVTDRRIGTQELFIRFALNLDQVRHLHHFVDVAEDLADALLCSRAQSCGCGGGSRLGHGRVLPLR